MGTGRKPKYTEEIIREIAHSKGGKLIEIFYDDNNRRKATYICKNNHEWSADASNIATSWCKQCSKNKPITQYEVEKLISKLGGKLLSSYTNNLIKISIECNEGHVWETSFSHIKHSNSWCPKCSNNVPPTQEMVEQYAIEKYGTCLSTYVNSKTKMQWVCELGHVWKSDYNHIRGGDWCPQCSVTRKPTQKEVNMLAKKVGGKCLSKYINSKTKMNWVCSNGHTWKAVYNTIKRGSWCPHCRNKTEKYCRDIFECIFGCDFPNTRPNWLRNSTGNKLELDGYSEEIDIAFEYNGIQHYEVATWWNKTDKDLAKQQKHDKIKVDTCEEYDVTLIVIPYLQKRKDIRDFIYIELLEITLTEYCDNDLYDNLL
jgi:hypothetical protein